MKIQPPMLKNAVYSKTIVAEIRSCACKPHTNSRLTPVEISEVPFFFGNFIMAPRRPWVFIRQWNRSCHSCFVKRPAYGVGGG